MSDAVIEVERVWKRFRRGTEDSLRDLLPTLARRIFHPRKEGELRERELGALKDVSFQVRRGEALGIIGPNGAGKSTILKLLSGILRPNLGRTRVLGRISALIEVAAGFHPDLTGRENVYLNGSILGMRKREIDRKYDQIVEFAGIGEFMDTPVKRYSSGMYARLGFSVAAHMEPDILLIDEVLAVGDYAFQAKCLKRMHEFRDSGAAVVFVSHNLRAVATLCNTAMLLVKGEKVAAGDAASVIRTYTQGETRERANGETTAPLRITQCALLDRQGMDRRNFQAGETATVVLRARAQQPVTYPSLGFWVSTMQGIHVFSTSTHTSGQILKSVDVGHTVEARFPLRLNLGPGEYLIGTLARRYETLEMFDVRDSSITIFVTGDGASSGLAYLEPTCAYQDLGTGEPPPLETQPPDPPPE